MAAAMVVEALLSASVETLRDRITSSEFQDFLKNRKLNVSLLDEMKTTLLMLNAVLNDAEEKQITDPAVKQWLDELKDAVLDAEDLLDKINTDSLRCKIEQDSADQNVVANKVITFLPSSFSQLSWGMNSKLEAVTQRLNNFAKQKDILGLKSVSLRAHKTSTTSFVNEPDVVGREDDKEKLLDMLLSEEDASGSSNIGVITILGMGGVGKTTLAQLLYNDERVQKQFDLKAWACVSEDFDILMVTKNLLESITSKVYNSNNLDFLRVELKRNLVDKKFLFVLDDLWNEKYNDWDDLVTPFRYGKRGSKIIVTTRQQRVAEVTHTFPIHKLTPLSDENCWHLLAKHAFRKEDPNKYPQLEAIGRKIARKCGGLPIAAKTLGGLLCSKVDANEWNKILCSNLWDLPHDDVLPALRLSYLYLPSNLKKCFAYCSIFPKDHLLNREKLVLLWMAEGFVQGQTMELEANDYFDELLSRSLIQKSEGSFEEGFIMHDLINDLAKVVSGKSCLFFDGNEEIPKNIRHLSYQRNWYDGPKQFESFDELRCLRTFLPQFRYYLGYSLTRQVTHNLLPKLECLRVLSLAGYGNITELPNSIGNLEHLRYLNLESTSIQRLPDAICTLYNLQTLILSYCRKLIELPAKIGNLIDLRYLDISETGLKEMPTQISKLHNLRSLSCFFVGRHQDGLRVSELKKFPHLQGKLCILNLQNVVDSMDAVKADLKSKQQIEELVLEWGSDTQDSQLTRDVLDKLQSSTKLRRLAINYYGGTSFPNWVGDSSFSNITYLSIRDCKYCFSLPPFGQLLSLKRLSIRGMKSMQTIGHEFYFSNIGSSSFHPFPSLEYLKFVDMPNWEEWLPIEAEGKILPFPRLQTLILYMCPNLRGDLPNHLPSLKECSISGCNQLEAKSSSLHWITSIDKLSIEECGQGFLGVFDSDSQSSLSELRIEKCDSLQCLPRMILRGNFLTSLGIRDIPSLMCFPNNSLPTSLRILEIVNCEKLEFLPQEVWLDYTSLESLEIRHSCHSLTSFPLGCFPQLKSLSIEDCPNLELFTQVEESALTLESFDITECKSLKSMSQVQSNSLLALKFLALRRLPNLESLPQGGLPCNLGSITVLNCERLSSMAIAEWGFQQLSCLSSFEIGGDDIINKLVNQRLLPASLEDLTVHDLSYLKGLQYLTSLKELRIYDCSNLESLPEDELPSSLLALGILWCPKLEERYGNQKGKHWSKIAYIPTIEINGEVIDRYQTSPS